VVGDLIAVLGVEGLFEKANIWRFSAVVDGFSVFGMEMDALQR